ncbi:unnamed protein product, partial [Mesorhabditis spiculigera]
MDATKKAGDKLEPIEEYQAPQYAPTPLTATSAAFDTTLCHDPQHIFPQQKITDPPARTDNNGSAPPFSPGIRTATNAVSTPIVTATARTPQNLHPNAAVVATTPPVGLCSRCGFAGEVQDTYGPLACWQCRRDFLSALRRQPKPGTPICNRNCGLKDKCSYHRLKRFLDLGFDPSSVRTYKEQE